MADRKQTSQQASNLKLVLTLIFSDCPTDDIQRKIKALEKLGVTDPDDLKNLVYPMLQNRSEFKAAEKNKLIKFVKKNYAKEYAENVKLSTNKEAELNTRILEATIALKSSIADFWTPEKIWILKKIEEKEKELKNLERGNTQVEKKNKGKSRETDGFVEVLAMGLNTFANAYNTEKDIERVKMELEEYKRQLNEINDRFMSLLDTSLRDKMGMLSLFH